MELLSIKALIHNWLPGPGNLEGPTNYGVDCSKIPPSSKKGESPSKLIPFHYIPRYRGDGGGGDKILFYEMWCLRAAGTKKDFEQNRKNSFWGRYV